MLLNIPGQNVAVRNGTFPRRKRKKCKRKQKYIIHGYAWVFTGVSDVMLGEVRSGRL